MMHDHPLIQHAGQSVPSPLPRPETVPVNNLSITSSPNPISQTSTVSTSRVGAGAGTSAATLLAGTNPAGDTKTISPAGQLFADLQALQQSDPAKFKQVLTDIANKLSSLSQQSGTSSSTSQILTDLSKSLEQVANSGDITQLLPKKHAHHAHQAASSAASNQPSNLLQLLNNGTGQTGSSTSIQDILNSLVSAVSSAGGSTGATGVA